MSAARTCPVARWAEATPEAAALVFGDRRWSWAQLDAWVDRWASRLAERGLGAGARLAVLAKNHPALVPAFHACARLGAVYVPLNARLTAREIAAQAERVAPRLWLVDRELAANVPAGAPSVSSSEALPEVRAHLPSTLPDPASVRALLFTSGTAGTSRAVQLTYGNFDACARASGENLGRRSNQRWLACMPLFHVGALAMVHRCADYGATLVLQERFDPAAVWRALREQDVTHLSVVPTGLRALLELNEDRAPESLRAVLVGGGPVPLHLMGRARGRGFPVLHTYGLTEATSQVATERPGEADGATAGQPLPGFEVRIVEGEIQVRGPNVMVGYLGDDAATQERLRDGWFRTGDLGALDERGRVRVFARRTDLIVTGGENVYPAEVEAVLAAHPHVDEVAVVAVDDEKWGQVPAAVVVPRAPPIVADGQARYPEVGPELTAWCRERLAGFKVPKWFHPVERLPKTGSGKVDRAGVRALVETVFEPGEKR